MSDNLPFEIQVEIMKRLPVKSLIQFRSVSKAWKSLLDSSDFIAQYSGQTTNLIVSHREGPVYYSFADDDTFPQHKVSLTTPQFIDYCSTIGCSHGLLCLYSAYHYLNGVGGYIGVNMAVLWNPSIRKVVAVVVPNVRDGIYETVLGFGVCRETVDPKIVKITYVNSYSDMGSTTCIPWQVEVFPLSIGAWRSSYNNLPHKSIAFTNQRVELDGFLYWLASDRITIDKAYNLVISFDMTSEEFREVNLPDKLANKPNFSLSISKLRESLVVLEQGEEANNLVIVVWMMEDGVPKSFTKLFSANVHAPDDAWVLGFRHNGEAIIEIREDYDGQLVVYEPYSKRTYNLGVDGMKFSFSVCSYKETLLLLDHPSLKVYNGKKTLKFEDDLLQEQLQLLI